MRNIELLNKIIDRIEAHPEEWYQNDWAIKNSCRTAYCVAGHAAFMSGANILWNFGWANSVATEDGSVSESIENYARRTLGLSRYEADMLFDGHNSLAKIKEIRDEFQRRNEEENA